jgi:hypothetical protein
MPVSGENCYFPMNLFIFVNFVDQGDYRCSVLHFEGSSFEEIVLHIDYQKRVVKFVDFVHFPDNFLFAFEVMKCRENFVQKIIMMNNR